MQYITIEGVIYDQNICRISLLINLEIAANEVKCRKPYTCTICENTINTGETALKTQQRHRRDSILYNNFCQDCYSIR